jgi:two-component system, OmpR family, phosphate regulon sensor histidine kinase PhoR
MEETMAVYDLQEVASLLQGERNHLLVEWEDEVRKRTVTARYLDSSSVINHLGDLLDELTHELETCKDVTNIEGLKQEPMTHGLHRLQQNFNIEEVVADYNALRDIIQRFIERHNVDMHGNINIIINRVIDKSIGLSLKAYTEQKAREVQKRREEYLMFLTHDLRSPLAAIGLAAHLYERRLGDKKDEQTGRFLANLHRNLTQLNNLVMRIVHQEFLDGDISPKVTGHDIHIKEMVEKVIDSISPLSEGAGTRLVNNVPPEITVFADENLVDLIFQNLISNAIKYTPKGEISIGAKRLDKDYVECWVADNGTGIPENRIGKVFEKLETDPTRRGGLGLGLAIVKRFVEVHHGKVWVESKEGQGSTFRFTLPVHTWPE